MPRSATHDLLILGAGCAGLSLANELIRRDSKLRVLLLERRTEYHNDRTWCFWAPPQHAYGHCVSARWPSWRFSQGLERHDLSSARGLQYQCVPAANFYADSRSKLKTQTAIELALGHSVRSLESKEDGVLVRCDDSEFYAPWAIDTRPQPPASQPYAQHFIGLELVAEQDCFADDLAGVMEDMACDEYGFRFNYVLPFSRRHVLLEATRFGRHVPKDALERDLRALLRARLQNTAFRELRREQGMIPMQVAAPAEMGGRLLQAGLAGGAARASTGYAFLRIQHWAARCAEHLLTNQHPITQPPDPRWRRWVDQLFLRVIEQYPERAPAFFMAMAGGVASDTLLRFLSDEGRPQDFMKVAAALPKAPFLRALPAAMGASRA